MRKNKLVMHLNKLLQFFFIFLLLGIPVLFLVILEGKNDFLSQKKFYNLLFRLAKVLLFIFLLIGIYSFSFTRTLKLTKLVKLFGASFLLLEEFFVLNYFGTPYQENRENVLKFLKSFLSFLLENSLFFFFAFLVYLFLSHLSKEIQIAFLASIISFILSRFLYQYNQEKKEIKSSAFLVQIILNIGILYYLSYVNQFLMTFVRSGAILGVELKELLMTIFWMMIILYGTYHFTSFEKMRKKHFKK